jgi:hypothetical protein
MVDPKTAHEAPAFSGSALVTLDVKRARFSLTAGVLDLIGWQDLPEGSILISVFVTEGHQQVYRDGPFVQELIRVGEERIRKKATNPTMLTVGLQSLADQFRPIRFEKKESRVIVGDEVVSALVGIVDEEAKPKLYVQVGDRCIDVMAHELRMRRLADLG